MVGTRRAVFLLTLIIAVSFPVVADDKTAEMLTQDGAADPQDGAKLSTPSGLRVMLR